MIYMEMLLLHPTGMSSVMMEFFMKKMQKNSYSQVTRHTRDQLYLEQCHSKVRFSILIQNGTRINSKVATFEIFFYSSHRNGCINHIKFIIIIINQIIDYNENFLFYENQPFIGE